ncbi:MAG: TetR/AcrR family transcriptional regulator [Fibrobacterota bacterium]
MAVDTRKKILAAADTVFCSEGYSKTTLRMISAAADVHVSLINYHFGSKKNLYKMVAAHYFSRMKDSFIHVLEEKTHILGKIEAFIRVHYDFVTAKGCNHRRMLTEFHISQEIISECIQDGTVEGFDFLHELLVTDIERGAAAGEIRQVSPVHLIINIISMNIFYSVAGKQLLLPFNSAVDCVRFEETRVDEIVDLVITGLLPNKKDDE